MWHPLGSLFKRPAAAGWSEVDIRYLVQDYIQRELKTDDVWCESVKDGRAILHVASPILVQQVRLLTFDIQRAVQEKTGYELHNIHIQR